MTASITHDGAGHRFTTTVDGHQAYVQYEPGDGEIIITHTIVPGEIGGRGIGGELVREALEFARSEGSRVVLRCSYAEGYVKKHPEYASLAA